MSRNKNKLIYQVGGNPQLLQHACHRLVSIAHKQKEAITVKRIYDTIEYLFLKNSNLATLMREVKQDNFLEDLIQKIIKGEKIKYLPYKEYSIAGTGPIVKGSDGFCTIRSPLYRKYLRDILEIYPEGAATMFICYSRKDEKWLREFLKFPHVDDRQRILFEWEAQAEKPFDRWYYEFQENLSNAHIAIFLISDHSLTSDFLLRQEIQALLMESKEKSKNIFHLLVPSTTVETIHKLAEFGKENKKQVDSKV